MINWDIVEFEELGHVVLKKEPFITCEKVELERRVSNRSEQIGFWKELLNEWEQKGILN